MRLRTLQRAAALAATGALIASVGTFAAELVTAELTAPNNYVEVEQGDSANFTISVSATGNVAQDTTHTATVDTVYAIDASGNLTAGTPSGVLNFTGPASGSPSVPITWAGAPTPQTVSASVSAASTTPLGVYTITLSEGAFTTTTDSSNGTGGKLDDAIATTITVKVIPSSAPVNRAPTADAGGDYAGNEGAAIGIDGSGSSDPDAGDSLTYAWTVEAGAPCSFASATSAATTVTCTDNGTFTVTLEVTDEGGLTDTDTADVVVANVDPVIGTVAWSNATVSCGTNNATLSVPFTDAGSSDTHTASVTWGDGSSAESLGTVTSPISASHTFNSGTYSTGSVTVTDDDNGSDTENLPSLTVLFKDSGIRQPINTDGTSTFKLGSTIPVKIQFTDCNDQVIDTLAPVIALRRVDTSPDGPVNEAPPAASADFGNVMRWSADGQQYIFNLSTKRSQFNGGVDLVQGTYELKIYVGSNTYETVTFSIRK